MQKREQFAADGVTHDAAPVDSRYLEELIAYYSEAGADYQAWSPNLNMHFGFFRRGMNPLQLEAMLERMNHEVLSRVAPKPGDHLLDIGCGVGTVARNAATWFPDCRVTGINLVTQALETARQITQGDGLDCQINFVRGDFRQLPFAEASYDGAYAIESACHAPGINKADVIWETCRVLKSGSRFVVADGFLKTTDPMPPALNRLYRLFCRCWALETLANQSDFVKALFDSGFREVQVEDIGWHIAPSAAFVPLAAVRWLLRHFRLHGKVVSRRQIRHAIAPFVLPAFAVYPRYFQYCLITATK